MADIFISYAREDESFAARLVPKLEAEGFTVWWDHTIPPGKTWDEVIARGIEEAKACVVLWSAHASASDWVKEEATLAKDAGKYLPATIDGAQPPVGFRRIQAADLHGWSGEANNPQWRMLVNEARALVGGAPAPAAQTPPRISRTNVAAAIISVLAVSITAFAIFIMPRLQQPPPQETKLGPVTVPVEVQAPADAEPERIETAAPSNPPSPAATRPAPPQSDPRDSAAARGWLGLRIGDLPEDSEHRGVLVHEVTPGSPAERAGLLPGDIVVLFNGTGAGNRFNLANLVAAVQPGDRVEVVYVRETHTATAWVQRRE